LLALFFGPEEGDDMFLRNIDWSSTDYTAWYLRRQKSSYPPLWEPRFFREHGR
jgi:hypothetical protein